MSVNEDLDQSILSTTAWNESYDRHENHVFWPCDEVVRFVSKYIRRRVGLDSFVDLLPGAANSRVLDLGCGIGRNLNFGKSMGFEMYGVDLSERAIIKAREWMARLGEPDCTQRIISGDVRRLPWPDEYFDHAISDSVLDSMDGQVAAAGVAELARVLKPGAYFYCNLIAQPLESGNGFRVIEERKSELHERGTTQAYFDQAKIDRLFCSNFSIVKQEIHIITEISRDETT